MKVNFFFFSDSCLKIYTAHFVKLKGGQSAKISGMILVVGMGNDPVT